MSFIWEKKMFDLGLFLILVLAPLVGIVLASMSLDWYQQKCQSHDVNLEQL